MGSERPARHPCQGLLQFKVRHYPPAGDNSVTALTRLSIAALRFPCVTVNTALVINSESLLIKRYCAARFGALLASISPDTTGVRLGGLASLSRLTLCERAPSIGSPVVRKSPCAWAVTQPAADIGPATPPTLHLKTSFMDRDLKIAPF